MTDLIRTKLGNKAAKSRSFSEYISCIEDLIQNEVIDSLHGFVQHGSVTCFDHSLSVSYYSYAVCRIMRLDYRAAARGGLLHDLFLYDWHKTKIAGGMHGFTHPYTAYENASRHFILNKREKDIIIKHMWPLTLFLPKYWESFVVSFVDKYCAILEIARHCKNKFIEYKCASFSRI